MNPNRNAPLNMEPETFRNLGHDLIDQLANFLAELPHGPITAGDSPQAIQELLPKGAIPNEGSGAEILLRQAHELLAKHSLFNGHPKFFGYITSSPAPIGALADLLAAMMNPNMGAFILSPMATEIERQVIRWLAELIGLPCTYDGILVSGGNMANFTGFLAGRTAKAPKLIKEGGMQSAPKRLLVYCSKTTHTWIEKAVILFGLGLQSIRWVPADGNHRMDIQALKQMIKQDLAEDHQPMMVIGTAGDVSTGAVDNLSELATVCQAFDLWFHIDGAYGIPAACLPELNAMFQGMEQADSLALDPHKWLYAPLEAGCALVKNGRHLVETFSSNPDYYHFGQYGEEKARNFFEYGLQNSRGFRALKVWLSLQQVGRQGYEQMIREDIELAELLYKLADDHPQLEVASQNLSITTLRFIPEDLTESTAIRADYLNALNRQLLDVLQAKGEVFPSNAVINEAYYLRFCIVNFRTTEQDIHETISILIREGRQLHQSMRQEMVISK